MIGRTAVYCASLFILSHHQIGDSWATSSAERTQATVVRHHELFVQIHPDTHALIAEDRLTLEIAEPGRPIRLSLARTLTVNRIMLAPAGERGGEPARDIPFEIEQGSGPQPAQRIAIPAGAVGSGQATLILSYDGTINDPPKEPRHLRFVTPSETAGHIGPEGVYLSSESQWYPDAEGSLSTFQVRAALPQGWTAVTQAKLRWTGPCPADRCRQTGLMLTEWATTQPTEALTVAANRFVPKTRDWSARNGQSIQLAAYLFQENAQLADEYLDASARYLDAYIPLLGPYPFETFAVVENFFASGLGMPSFTLLGSGVIKRHYVQPYALGHEIVHSWIGNGVLNRVDRGNWVEGLTTYLANYYWYELTGDLTQAREQRRLFQRGYNLHVPQDRDYPVGAFTQKQDERDNAIGYQKAAMVFHQLRQEVGEDRFWQALKRLVEQHQGRYAEWRDVERTFSEAAGRDLRWFFAQWVERPGAPTLSITRAVSRQAGGGRPASFHLDVGITQAGTPFRAAVQLLVRTEDGRDHIIPVHLNDGVESLSVQLPVRPVMVALDPDAMLMRRMPRESLPPVLNHYVTDPCRSVVPAFADQPASAHPFGELVKRIQGQDSRRPESERTSIVHVTGDLLFPQDGSVLLLSGPEFRVAIREMVSTHCGDRVRLGDQAVVVDGKAYEGAGTSLLASCHRAGHPGSVVSLLYAATPQAASAVSRLLFFYGWNSFVVFQDGAVTVRGEWPGVGSQADRMEVRFDGTDVVR